MKRKLLIYERGMSPHEHPHECERMWNLRKIFLPLWFWVHGVYDILKTWVKAYYMKSEKKWRSMDCVIVKEEFMETFTFEMEYWFFLSH